MLMWGAAGGPLPHRVRLTVVVGKPIEPPAELMAANAWGADGRQASPPPSPRRGGGGARWRGQHVPPASPTKAGHHHPPREAVAAVHAAYLEAVEAMYARHAAACGQGDVPLVVM
jgi:hypothetical protein